MDYEKKYKESFERAKEKYTKCYSPTLLDYIFPELKENKDIEIKKDIISNLKRYVNCIKDGYDTSSAKDFVIKTIEKQIAWLEKQNKQKPIFNADDWYVSKVDGKIHNFKFVEKQNEQKSADSYCQKNCRGFQEIGKYFADGECKAKREAESNNKVKPKFKVGDWIVNNISKDVFLIKSINDGYYTLEDIKGNIISPCLPPCESEAHLWTIQDAKEGDVLVCKGKIKRSKIKYERICLFNNLDNAFFTLTKTSNHAEEYSVDVNIDYPDNTVPATKKQKEILFMAMADAGYTFDFKNKEFKKIETEIEIPFGAKDSELQEATYYIPVGFHAEIDGDFVVIKKGEKPTVLNEDSERIRKRLIDLVNEVYDNTNYITFLEHKELLTWLEKLNDNIEL